MTHLYLALLFSFQSATAPVIPPAPALPPDIKPEFRANDSPTCVSWRGARDGSDKDAELRSGYHRMWVLGYITGFNFAGPDQTGDLLGTATREEVYSAIDGYCARNPSRIVVDAMRPVIDAIIRRRGTPATSSTPSGNARKAMVVAGYSCRDWIEGRDNKLLQLLYINMLHGHITAYNQWGPDPAGDAIGAADASMTTEVVDKWCSEHPSALLVGTIKPLIDHVAKERAVGRLPPGGFLATDRFSDTRSRGTRNRE